MPQRQKQKYPPRREEDSLAYRQAEFSREEAKTEDRSLPVTLATETAVRVFDWQEGRIASEVLVMAGGNVPKQLPLLDSHSRYAVRDIRGSIRDLRIEDDKLVGRAYFAANKEGQEAFDLARDGHLSDVSIGFQPVQIERLSKGESKRIGGREYHGPTRLVTKWRAIEGSLVAIGADENAKLSPARRAYLNPDEAKGHFMNDQFRALCVAKGMKADLSDEEAIRWAEENLDKRSIPDPAKEAASAEQQRQATEIDADKAAADIAERALKKIDDARKAREEHRVSIRKMAVAAGLRDANEVAERMFNDGVSVSDAGLQILEMQSEQRTSAAGIFVTHDHGDKFRSAVLDGLTLRTMSGARPAADWKPSEGADQFRRMPLMEVARQSLVHQGVDVRRMDEREIFRRATAMQDQTRASDGQAYLTTGHFANLLLDAVNKTLLKSFMDTRLTYESWVGRGESVPDFKNIYRVRLGEIGNQPTVGENDEYKDVSLSDAKESYRVEKRGSIVSLTWEAYKNDDLGGFSRIVTLQGSAMKRTINRSVYQIFFDNPTLSDGVALFHSSSHGANLVTSDLAVSVLDTAYSAMMLQTGLNSDVILGIEPRYLVVAPGISGTAMQLLGSTADPAAGGSAAGNSNTHNNYGPGGARRLELLVEATLAGNDTDSWYLIADSNQIDTVELTFLQGEETPVFEQETAFIQDAVKYKIRQTWGVKAIDYRGLYKSAGNG